MTAGLGLFPVHTGGMVFGPLASWLLLLGAVAVASAVLWWTGRPIRDPRTQASPHARRC